MSAIASFTLLPKTCLQQLREAAVPLQLAGKSQDAFWQFLEAHGKEAATYNWSGYVLVTCLPYLQQQRNIEFSDPEFEELESFMCSVRGSTFSILTDKHRETYLSELAPEKFSEVELREFFEVFNATKFNEAGKAMLDGIGALRTSLSKVDGSSVILLHIG